MAKRYPNDSTKIDLMELGKIPPQCIEIEEVVLGALLLEKNAIENVLSIITPQSFYKDDHQKICIAIFELHNKEKSIDIMTVTEQLRRNKTLEEVGGPLYIAQLTNRVASAAHIETHARLIQEKYIKRELIRITSEIQSASYDDSIDLQELLDYYNKLSDKLNELASGRVQIKNFDSVLKQSVSELKVRKQNIKEGKKTGIEPPLKGLRNLIYYWVNDLILIAARPSDGKTNFVLHIAKEAALQKKYVCIYSMETDAVKLADRLLIAEANINDYDYRSGYISDKDVVNIELAAKRLSELPIYIDDNPVVGVNYIKNHSRMMHKKGKCDMIIIDYIQLTDTSEYKRMTRDQEIGIITRGLKTHARTIQVPVIAISQLSREVTKKGGSGRPELGNLRESGNLEQDAYAVLFIYRPERHGIFEEENGISTKGVGYIIVAKNKDGPIGEVRFRQKYGLRYIWDYEEGEKPIPEYSGKDKQIKDEDDFFNIFDDTPF